MIKVEEQKDRFEMTNLASVLSGSASLWSVYH